MSERIWCARSNYFWLLNTSKFHFFVNFKKFCRASPEWNLNATVRGLPSAQQSFCLEGVGGLLVYQGLNEYVWIIAASNSMEVSEMVLVDGCVGMLLLQHILLHISLPSSLDLCGAALKKIILSCPN